MKKKFILFFSFLILIELFSSKVFFAEKEKIINEESNKFEKIYIEEIEKEVYVKKGLNIPKEVMIEIASKSKDKIITFYNYKKNSFQKNNTRASRTYVIRDHHIRDIYKNQKTLASVAKGAKYTLEKAVSYNDSISVSGSVGADILSIAKDNLSSSYGNGVSETIKVGRVFTGPDENSEANSRTYYCAIKTRVGYLQIKKVGQPNSEFKKVDYEVPLDLVEWLEDSKI